MKLFLSFLLILLLTGCSGFYQPEQKENGVPQALYTGSVACFAENCFRMEIADDTTERQKGLMWRETLDKDAGMLFIFPNEAPGRTFWMKNTLISLDMIWLDEAYTIVYIEKDVPPCTTPQCPSYGPSSALTQYVIELNAGTFEELGSAIGDKVDITLK